MTIVCIAGMHRSGTSMVSRLLNLCGLHLGGAEDMHPAAKDNPAGYWEHAGFVELNERILDLSGTGWGLHAPLAEDWLENPALEDLVPRAIELVDGLRRPDAMWGWKDPRNSITLPFWLRLVKEPVAVVHCLRHPADVAKSLAARDQHIPDDVWFEYNDALVRTSGIRRIVTHYDTYFHDPAAELRRVLGFLGATFSEEMLAQSCTAVRSDLRHNLTPDLARDCVPAAAGLYMDLCSEAGPVFAAAHGVELREAAAAPVRLYEILENARDAQRRRSQLARRVQQDVEAHRRRLLETVAELEHFRLEAARLANELQEHVLLVEQLRGELLEVGEERAALRRAIDYVVGNRRYRLAARMRIVRSAP